MRLLKTLVIVVFLLMISLASLAEEVPSLGVDFTPGKPTVRASYISDTEYKVSMRSNRYVDVSAVATSFGGGGHVRAAGCTLDGTPDEIVVRLSEQIAKQI